MMKTWGRPLVNWLRLLVSVVGLCALLGCAHLRPAPPGSAGADTVSGPHCSHTWDSEAYDALFLWLMETWSR